MREPNEESVILEPGDDPEPSTTIAAAIVGAVLLFAIVVALEGLYYWREHREFERKVVSQRPEQLRLVQTEALEKLRGYRWVDREKGVLAVPIERAMALVVEESRRRAPADEAR